VYKVASVPRNSMLKMHVKPQVMDGQARLIFMFLPLLSSFISRVLCG
jgi:hypothetical protein